MKRGIAISFLFVGFSMYYAGMLIQDSQAAVSEVTGYVFQTYTGNNSTARVKSPPRSFVKPPPIGTSAICPVTGNEFLVTLNTLRSKYKGRYYVFCSTGCKIEFDATPENYTGN